MSLRGTASMLATVVALLGAFAPAAAAQGPGSPEGVNDECRSDQSATPVVLVHGTFATQQEFVRLAPFLEHRGYCTYALNYGCRGSSVSCGTGRIQASARELEAFIDKVLAGESRSGKVSIVGHSQGGLMPRYYLRFLGGRSEVTDMISFSASNHGTDNPLAPFSQDCPACKQQAPYMSSFTRQVNEGDETFGRISYTQVQTRYDDVVIPYFSSYLAENPGTPNGPRTTRQNGPRTTNYCLQDQFPTNTSDHLTIVGDPQAFVPVLNALRRSGPARPPARPDSVCARLGGDPGGGGSGARGPRRCTISGSEENDVLVGTPRNDVICGGGGNDVIRGGGGDDTLRGGGDNDTVRGDTGADDLLGEGGRDTLNSSDGIRGNDSANGGAGSDVCNGDFGDGRTGCP